MQLLVLLACLGPCPQEAVNEGCAQGQADAEDANLSDERDRGDSAYERCYEAAYESCWSAIAEADAGCGDAAEWGCGAASVYGPQCVADVYYQSRTDPTGIGDLDPECYDKAYWACWETLCLE